jgi:hypothetical protein
VGVRSLLGIICLLREQFVASKRALGHRRPGDSQFLRATPSTAFFSRCPFQGGLEGGCVILA